MRTRSAAGTRCSTEKTLPDFGSLRGCSDGTRFSLSVEQHADDVQAFGVIHADDPALRARSLAVDVDPEAAASELARVRLDCFDLRVDGLRHIDVYPGQERGLHRPAVRRVVAEQVEEPQPLR